MTSETRAEAEARLPDAEARCPSCQVCGDETDYEDGVFRCEPCGLTYDRTDLTAAYIDDEAEPCAKPCTASWHKPNSITAIPGWSYECRTCALPTGHTSDCWTDCTTRYTPSRRSHDHR